MVEKILATAAVDLEEAHVNAERLPAGHLSQLFEQVARGIFLSRKGGTGHGGRRPRNQNHPSI